jgi:hypothetical protein
LKMMPLLTRRYITTHGISGTADYTIEFFDENWSRNHELYCYDGTMGLSV